MLAVDALLPHASAATLSACRVLSAKSPSPLSFPYSSSIPFLFFLSRPVSISISFVLFLSFLPFFLFLSFFFGRCTEDVGSGGREGMSLADVTPGSLSSTVSPLFLLLLFPLSLFRSRFNPRLYIILSNQIPGTIYQQAKYSPPK